MKVSCKVEGREVSERSWHDDGTLDADAHHRPVLAGLADVDDKVLDDLLALGRVGNLGVELDAEDRPRLVGDGSKGRRRRLGDRDKVGRQSRHLVAVRHPDLFSQAWRALSAEA
jgi:hypothetical protein